MDIRIAIIWISSIRIRGDPEGIDALIMPVE
jgi:hypothetical protein